MNGPRLERVETPEGDIVYCWIADPPLIGVAFRVLEEEWDTTATPPVRVIKRVELV